VLRRGSGATLIFVRPDPVEGDRRLVRDREQEASLLRRHHVVAVEPDAECAEHLGPERQGDAGEPAESSITLDLLDEWEPRQELRSCLDEDRSAGANDLRPCSGSVDRVSLPPVVGRFVQGGTHEHLQSARVVVAADRQPARIRAQRIDRRGDGRLRDVLRGRGPCEHFRDRLQPMEPVARCPLP
jgi:hypothetical protein